MKPVTEPTLHPAIRRVPPRAEPLSSDVFLMEGDSRYYVFDAGNSDAACEAIRSLPKPVTFILSHFHRDHTGNLSRLEGEILGGARTCKTLGRGTRVDAPLLIEDGIRLLVQPCVSPHAPGCLILTVDEQLTFLGDLPYAQPGKGSGEMTGMLRTLQGIKTEAFVLSHGETFRAISKAELLERLTKELR